VSGSTRRSQTALRTSKTWFLSDGRRIAFWYVTMSSRRMRSFPPPASPVNIPAASSVGSGPGDERLTERRCFDQSPRRPGSIPGKIQRYSGDSRYRLTAATRRMASSSSAQMIRTRTSGFRPISQRARRIVQSVVFPCRHGARMPA